MAWTSQKLVKEIRCYKTDGYEITYSRDFVENLSFKFPWILLNRWTFSSKSIYSAQMHLKHVNRKTRMPPTLCQILITVLSDTGTPCTNFKPLFKLLDFHFTSSSWLICKVYFPWDLKVWSIKLNRDYNFNKQMLLKTMTRR